MRNDNNEFDRLFFGKPGFMIILILLVIGGTVLYNYFFK